MPRWGQVVCVRAERGIAHYRRAHRISNRGEFFPSRTVGAALRRSYAETGFWERDEATSADGMGRVGRTSIIPTATTGAYELSTICTPRSTTAGIQNEAPPPWPAVDTCSGEEGHRISLVIVPRTPEAGDAGNCGCQLEGTRASFFHGRRSLDVLIYSLSEKTRGLAQVGIVGEVSRDQPQMYASQRSSRAPVSSRGMRARLSPRCQRRVAPCGGALCRRECVAPGPRASAESKCSSPTRAASTSAGPEEGGKPTAPPESSRGARSFSQPVEGRRAAAKLKRRGRWGNW